jgi:hypothetical protein
VHVHRASRHRQRAHQPPVAGWAGSESPGQKGRTGPGHWATGHSLLKGSPVPGAARRRSPGGIFNFNLALTEAGSLCQWHSGSGMSETGSLALRGARLGRFPI